LDAPEVGQLYLFSLHVADDALAVNSLPSLVVQATNALGDSEDAARLFSERLATARYNPAEADRYNRPLRLISEELFRVSDLFPRLTTASFPSGVPPGLAGISYTLSVGACGPWRVASSPTDAGAAFLQQGVSNLKT
jgi:hypothetical protein